MSTFRPSLAIEQHRQPLLAILRAVIAAPTFSYADLYQLLRQHLKVTSEGRRFFAKDELIAAYRAFTASGDLPPFDPAVLERLRLKPVRTTSGVTVITVLTKPFPCPGECIFCPNDVRMPKSYLRDEPGAQRAALNSFDPYLQTYTRLRALHNMGHPTDKIELIVLGGTWSFYPESYQIWFIKRLFDALHDFGRGIDRTEEVRALLESDSLAQFKPSAELPDRAVHGAQLERTYNQLVTALYAAEMQRSREQAAQVQAGILPRTPITEYATWQELEAAHRENESAPCRCVGLVVETRPDHISTDEVLRIRRLGCTKVQIGFQSLDDQILRLNKRGHTVAATRRAVRLLRAAGFKIHAHWMPNLYGATPESDRADYQRLFSDPDFCPDELKIYPCSLIESAELMQHYQRGNWQPYSTETLIALLADCMRATPEYCRLTRIIRDIPSTDIVAGNKLTNLRELVEMHLAERGERSRDIRAREIRGEPVATESLQLDELRYQTSIGQEYFLQFITAERRIAGFLRLCLPDQALQPLHPELESAAIIREVHIYGQALGIGQEVAGKAQHSGLGTRLIERAAQIARQSGYTRLAVISAVGTRAYYRSRGFADGQLYQVRSL
ncbi:MAG: tRNA uridine(34) 5-carboxymethylaminomethyl modification radical SAM/GNAT enzyme Elp3 [Anaerolineae bacterium]|nr:tRNA uridine(34) 5-carboxymethylaminomethyl modification radical SAM/GNAT enzyme Elp3 [Anaerolineae bacterium]MDW8298384.1 tRNA uridine(34) 5-carboxymethylaminomethyl modification radical SAM/GNAT enzyme Elp3 [Anaerolineae bacterium]